MSKLRTSCPPKLRHQRLSGLRYPGQMTDLGPQRDMYDQRGDPHQVTEISSLVSSILSGMDGISKNLEQLSIRSQSKKSHYSPYNFPPLRPRKSGNVPLPHLSELGLLNYGRQPLVHPSRLALPNLPPLHHSDVGLYRSLERLSLKEDDVHPLFHSLERLSLNDGNVHPSYPSPGRHSASAYCGFESRSEREFVLAPPRLIYA